VADDARLDDGAARAAGEQPVGLDAGALAAPEARAIAGGDLAGARDAAAGLLRGGERLGDEGPGLLRAGRADAARPDAEIVLALMAETPHIAQRRGNQENGEAQAAPIRRTSRNAP
jgi:hypothetical protein